MKQYRMEQNLNEPELRRFVSRCDAELEAQLDRVAEKVVSVPGLRMIGLTGPTCSGKTTAARKLTACAHSEGRRIHVISIDDFYYDKSYLQMRADLDPNIDIDYDSEETIDIALLSEKTDSLLSGRETVLPRFDFRSGLRVEGVSLKPEKDDLFLFEGIQTLYPKVNAILSGDVYRGIYISPQSSIEVGGELFEPNEIRLLRRLVRDFRYRSSAPEFTLYLWQSVRQNEEQNIFPNVHLCDLTVDSTMPCEIGLLKPYLEQMLPSIATENSYRRDAMEILRQLRNVRTVPSSYITKNSLYKEFI